MAKIIPKIAPDAAALPQLPNDGGSYEILADGTLKCLEPATQARPRTTIPATPAVVATESEN